VVTDAGRAADTARLLERVADADLLVDGPRVSARVRGAGHEVAGLIRELDAAGITLESIEVRRPTLDDVFLDLTGRSLREDV
ncbi:MAG: ABC transporter, partial [Herbiconiux sp.]|nr:ABC transporter [Herbiconiux sp.]